MVSLLSLPAEILHAIVVETMPEGFESLAMTCTTTHEICRPLIDKHNSLNARFSDFEYGPQSIGPLNVEIRSAWELIVSIAVEPAIARYMRRANFRSDSTFPRNSPYPKLTDNLSRRQVISLVESSPDASDVGIDPDWYATEIESDLDRRVYSQAAAALLLTFLPNLTSLTLPDKWSTNDFGGYEGSRHTGTDERIDRLVESILSRAERAYVDGHQPALAQVSHLGRSGWRHMCYNWLEGPRQFLTLTRVQHLYIHDCWENLPLDDEDSQLMANLQSIQFDSCFLPCDFLTPIMRAATKLSSLKYSFSDSRLRSKWCNVNQTLDTIREVAGARLEELSLSVACSRRSNPVGEISMHGFKRLRKLEIGVELLVTTVVARERSVGPTHPFEFPTDCFWQSEEWLERPLLASIVTTSVVELSLLSRAWVRQWEPHGMSGYHDKALELLFRDFEISKATLAPALQAVSLDCPEYAYDAYKEQCSKVSAEVGKTGVTVRLRYPTSADLVPPDTGNRPDGWQMRAVDGYDTAQYEAAVAQGYIW